MPTIQHTGAAAGVVPEARANHRGGAAAEPSRVLIADVIKAACRVGGVLERELISPRRDRELVRVRHAAVLVAREVAKASLERIGDRFQRDHSTVCQTSQAQRDRVRLGDADAVALTRAIAAEAREIARRRALGLRCPPAAPPTPPEAQPEKDPPMSKAGPPTQWTQQRDDEIAECLKQGFDDAMIARRLGVTTMAVTKRRGVLGLKRVTGPTPGVRRALCPPSVTAPPFSDEWWAQNDASFRAGVAGHLTATEVAA